MTSSDVSHVVNPEGHFKTDHMMHDLPQSQALQGTVWGQQHGVNASAGLKGPTLSRQHVAENQAVCNVYCLVHNGFGAIFVMKLCRQETCAKHISVIAENGRRSK